MPYYKTSAYPRRTSSYPRKYARKPRVQEGTRALPRLKRQPRAAYQSATARTAYDAFHSQIQRTPIFPMTKLIHDQFYYDPQLSLSGAAGVPASRVYSANGIFDVDITGTGHQPLGFDQMMLFYEHYGVIRSKISVTFMNDSDDAVRVGIYLNPDSTPIALPSDIMENGLIATAVCDSKDGTGERIKTVSLNCDMKKSMGKESYKAIINDKTVCGDAGSNPAEQTYFVVVAWGSHVAATTQLRFDVCISYDTIYFENRKTAGS